VVVEKSGDLNFSFPIKKSKRIIYLDTNVHY